MDHTLSFKEAHMYEARALPHWSSLYQNNKDDPFHEGSYPSYLESTLNLVYFTLDDFVISGQVMKYSKVISHQTIELPYT